MFNLKGLNRAKITNVNILLASVTATFLFSMYAASAVYMGTSTSSSTTNSSTTGVEYPEGTEQTISISSTDSINLFIDTTSRGTIAYGQGNVMISSNAAGYSLFVSSSSDDTSMHLTSNPSGPDVIQSTTTSDTILADIDTNSWAYSYGKKDSNYIEGHPETYLYEAIPAMSSPKYVDFNTSSSAIYSFYYGAKADKTAKDGTYTQTITYTLLAWGESIKNFDYTGAEQSFRAPYKGYYKLETWGAEGGAGYIDGANRDGGYGGYSMGYTYLNENDVLYINVGGEGTESPNNTKSGRSYNGGGSGSSSAGSQFLGARGGGGATHIAKVSGVLSSLSSYRGTPIYESDGTTVKTYNSPSILIVSGGGGGRPGDCSFGELNGRGGGGGYKGDQGTTNPYNKAIIYINGGSQTTGHAFGQGQDGHNGGSGLCGASGTGGGGGGWYGGLTYQYNGDSTDGLGAGGSGYIASSKLESFEGDDKHMTCYNCEESSDPSLKTQVKRRTSSTPQSDYPKIGNGYARITYVGV